MKIAFEYDTEKDAAELSKLEALVNALNPVNTLNTPLQQKKTELESLLNPTAPKVISIKENCKVSWTWGEQEISGTRIIIHYPKDTNDWMSLNNPHNKGKGYRVQDPKGTVHIIPNASSFARANNLDAILFGNLAAGRRKEYKSWKSVQQDYWHIQPYKNLEQAA